MNWFRQKAFLNLVLSIGCSLSMLLAPAKAVAQDGSTEFAPAPCCEVPGHQGCEEESCCVLGSKSSAVILAGALLAGVVAVAAANNHRDGSTGPRGPAGSDPFESNSGEILRFIFDAFTLDSSTDIPITVTPFVVAPNGTFYFGDASNFITTPGNNFFSALGIVEISNPVFGDYHFGIQVRNNSPTDTSNIAQSYVNMTVTASGRAETVVQVYAGSVPSVTLLIDGEYQVQGEYGYAEAVVP